MDNYPMGVNGSSDYFNQPDPPECLNCYMELEDHWRFCPMCGEPIDWKKLNGEEWHDGYALAQEERWEARNGR